MEKVQKGGGVRGQNQKSLHFKCRLTLTEGGSEFYRFSPISVEGGGVIENQFFPKFKKVQIILGGEGVKKIMDFFHKFWYFLFWTLP